MCKRQADSKTNHSKSDVGKTQVYDISKVKLEVGKYWLNCCNGSIEWKITKTGNKDINEIVEWFVHVRATELPIPETTVQKHAKQVAQKLQKTNMRANDEWLESFRNRH